MVVMACGIAMCINSNIGAPPGGVIAVAASHFVPLTIGQCAALFHVFCILTQILITRRPTVKHALQLPLAYVFGFLIDFFLELLVFEFPGIAYRVLFLLAGLLLLSLGIRAIVGANILLIPPDGLARAIGTAFNWPMSKGKLAFDIAATTVGLLMTWILAGNPFLVVGVGTVICAIGTGPLIGVYTKLLPFLDLDRKEVG